jgi:hypothetical protein
MVDMDHMDNVTFSLSDDISKNLVTPTNTNDVSSNALVVSANGWTPEIIRILDKIRINSMKMSDYHNKRYHTYKYYFYYYTRIPLIVLSGINTFVAIGLQPFTTQQNISVINALISLFCGVITSIELLVNLQKKMETELQSHKEYYRLAVFIYKVTKLDEKDRATEGRTYLNARISDYDKLIISNNYILPEIYKKMGLEDMITIDEMYCYYSSGLRSLCRHSYYFPSKLPDLSTIDNSPKDTNNTNKFSIRSDRRASYNNKFSF